jgi:hypothetical protein
LSIGIIFVIVLTPFALAAVVAVVVINANRRRRAEDATRNDRHAHRMESPMATMCERPPLNTSEFPVSDFPDGPPPNMLQPYSQQSYAPPPQQLSMHQPYRQEQGGSWFDAPPPPPPPPPPPRGYPQYHNGATPM